MNKFWSTLLAGAAGGLLVFGAMKWTATNADEKSTVEVVRVATPKQVRYEEAGTGSFDFTRAAERSMASVVHIKASESPQTAVQRYRRTNPFHFFFGDRFFFEDEIRPRSGTGSGVIYTRDGYILTNNHVIEFADEYQITLHDGREFKARLVGADASTDMAVLKIEASDLPAIEIGNSDAVRVGEWVLAVGNPFDLTSTVTAGIVSAKSRDINIIRGGAPIESFIQTDAAVNPGNSGGALVDAQGRLIGINTAIASPTGAFAGYSFAIPINLAKRIADDLIQYGKYRRAYMGVDIAPMDNNIANYLGIPFVQGVWVKALDPQGSAARGGVRPNDIITKVNNRPVASVPELQEIIGRSRAGETITLTVVREGKEKTLQVLLRSRGD
ncbi:MAG: trypsin-like peptidase domain-containing protein [Saprospiraceae bacterium]|nr:trypsin-like peptidase domain-containing protein [Saprospiraceae bacterium]MDW8231022.1 trypsin-like peptidase domain-containing protein [Saprospiraceae bacterium]